MLIRNKLTLRFTLLVVTIQLFFSAFIYYFTSLYRQQEFYSRLEGKARLAARLLIKRNLLPVQEKTTLEKGDLITLSDERISIFSQDRYLIYTNADSSYAQSHSLYVGKLKADDPFRYTTDRFEAVGIVYRYNQKNYFVFASGYDQSGFSKLENMAMILTLGNLLVLVLIIFAGWYFASQSLAPISRVVKEVESISGTRLDLRVDEGNGEDEIAKLSITFNQMLDRVHQAFVSQQSFVSHASHELRTPLTNALGTLETSYTYDKNLAESKASIASAIEEINNIIDLTNGLLSLTKADSPFSQQVLVRVDECVLEALALVKTKYRDREIHAFFQPIQKDPDQNDSDQKQQEVAYQQAEAYQQDSVHQEAKYTDDKDLEPFVIEANAQLIRTALFNILDNACKYSTQPVQVRLGRVEPNGYTITIIDQGIGIAQAELTNLFLPLYRASNGRHLPGFGIGLAVAKKIIDLYKGSISVESILTQGTCVTITLPAGPYLPVN